jgi:hypothetical protein
MTPNEVQRAVEELHYDYTRCRHRHHSGWGTGMGIMEYLLNHHKQVVPEPVLRGYLGASYGHITVDQLTESYYRRVNK